MHSKVQGEFAKKDGSLAHYKASDERYLLWVHCAFTDSFLKSYLMVGEGVRPPGDDESQLTGRELADAYVAEWSKSAIPLGLKSAPQSLEELERVLDEFRSEELALNEKTKERHKEVVTRAKAEKPVISVDLTAATSIVTMKRMGL